MRIVKQNRFKNFDERDKEWTEVGVKASRSTTHKRVKKFGYSCCQRHLTWAKEKKNWTVAQWSKVQSFVVAVVGLTDRALDLKPEVTQGWWVRIPAPAGSPRLLPGRCTVGCPLLQVCTLGWVKCREHISLLIILCIIVYVTNKAHPSLICIVVVLLLPKAPKVG